jgi:hypothetical protein
MSLRLTMYRQDNKTMEETDGKLSIQNS